MADLANSNKDVALVADVAVSFGDYGAGGKKKSGAGW